MSDTVLTLSLAGFPPLGLPLVEQELRPIAQHATRRTVNGALQDSGWSGWQKFETVITCELPLPPALGGIWPGMAVTVGCVLPLCEQLSGATSKTLAKTPVAGSVYAVDGLGNPIAVTGLTGRLLTLASFSGTASITYRPSLSMRVVDLRLTTKEAPRGSRNAGGWRLELSEI
jgi:hypothetical protein